MRLSSDNRQDQIIALALIALGAAFRIAPHPDNFTPTMAIALFAGTVLPPSVAFTVPLLVMMASDLFLGLHPLFWLIWGYFLVIVALGAWVRHRGASPLSALAATLGGSVAFFILSNLGVFLFQDFYPKSWEGLVECFMMALPFLRNTLAGDVSYSVALFGIFLAAKWTRQPKKIS